MSHSAIDLDVLAVSSRVFVAIKPFPILGGNPSQILPASGTARFGGNLLRRCTDGAPVRGHAVDTVHSTPALTLSNVFSQSASNSAWVMSPSSNTCRSARLWRTAISTFRLDLWLAFGAFPRRGDDLVLHANTLSTLICNGQVSWCCITPSNSSPRHFEHGSGSGVAFDVGVVLATTPQSLLTDSVLLF